MTTLSACPQPTPTALDRALLHIADRLERSVATRLLARGGVGATRREIARRDADSARRDVLAVGAAGILP